MIGLNTIKEAHMTSLIYNRRYNTIHKRRAAEIAFAVGLASFFVGLGFGYVWRMAQGF